LSQQHLLVVFCNNTVMTTNQLWSVFCSKNKSFSVKYKTFAFFKSKGSEIPLLHIAHLSLEHSLSNRFFIRSALNYGLDYSLYRYLPSLCHAEMCLLVVDASLSTTAPPQTATNQHQGVLSWKHLSCLTRLLPVSCLPSPSSRSSPLTLPRM
jgi:hypothetical protein